MGPLGPLALEPRTMQAEVRPFIPPSLSYSDLSAIAAHQFMADGTPTFDFALECYIHCGTSRPRRRKFVALLVYRPRAWCSRGGRGGGCKLMGLEEKSVIQAICTPRICHPSVMQSYNTRSSLTQCLRTHNKVLIRQVTLIQICSFLFAAVYLKRDNYRCWEQILRYS